MWDGQVKLRVILQGINGYDIAESGKNYEDVARNFWECETGVLLLDTHMSRLR
jgi:hypothetical protein